MYKLKYPQKFILISVVFIIPLAILMANELDMHAQRIAKAKLKLIGIHHIEETSKLARAIPEHRGMVNANLSNTRVFANTLQEKAAEIDRLFAVNTIVDHLDAASIHISDDWQGILDRWQTIQHLKDDPLTSWRLHSEMINLLNKHLRDVGKQTLLSFDADPFIHSLLALQLEVMPNLLETIGQLRGQGVSFMAKKSITPQDQIVLVGMSSHIMLLLQEAKQLLQASENASMPRSMRIASFRFISSSKGFVSTAEQQLIGDALFSISAEDYFMLGSAAIERGHKFNLSSLDFIEMLLDQRINASITAQYNIKLMVMIVALLLIFLFAAFYRSIMNTIAALSRVSEQMRRGETDRLTAIPGNDEMSDIVVSFNTIAEELMRVSSHMSAVVDHAVDGIITMDQHGIIKSFNPASEHIFAYSADEIIGQNVTDLMPESYRERHLAGLARYIECGKSAVLGRPLEVRGLKKNGDEFPMDLSINSMFIDGHQVFIGMVRDTSEHQELESQLRHAQKMEAVGALVGGVAHNFNNLLAGIVGKAYLAKIKASDNPDVLPYLDSIEAISVQAGDMVKQLLTFAHKDIFSRKHDTPLGILIKESFKTAKLGIEEDIDLSLNIDCIDDNNVDDNGVNGNGMDIMVHCDANHIQQVLMNMINNARDAVADSAEKRIRVSLTRVIPSATFFRHHPELNILPGQQSPAYACLQIDDSGHGMDRETMARIFEPFYTSKDVGKGTGLGLSTAFGSIQSHDGVIEVDSSPGKGTSFRVYLPIIQSSQTNDTPKEPLAVIPSQQSETLLLVDDETMVVESMQAILEELGYRVIVAQDGVEGLACFKQYQQQIQLVISDVVMPRMGGVDMFRQIRCINATIPTIFVTGYDQGKVQLQADERVNTMVVAKPVQVAQLSQLIQTALKHACCVARKG